MCSKIIGTGGSHVEQSQTQEDKYCMFSIIWGDEICGKKLPCVSFLQQVECFVETFLNIYQTYWERWCISQMPAVAKARRWRLNAGFPCKWQRPNYPSHCLPPSQAVHQQKLDSQWSWDINPGILTWYRYVPSSILTATLNTCPLSPFKRVFKVHKLHVDF